jgi:hypothetical protein
MLTQQDQDNVHALDLAVTPSHSRTSTRVVRRPVERSALLADRRRSVCAVLAVAAWAATAAAVIAGGEFGRGAALQITLAASMGTVALGETLLSPLWQAAVSDPGRPGAVGRASRPGAVAFVAVLLGSAAGGATLGAVLGAGWRTSLFTTVALVCATASIAAHHLGQHSPAGRHG